MDIALEGNFVSKPSNGWYAKVDQETGEIGDKKRFDDTQTAEFGMIFLLVRNLKNM
jgi:hypothetical protein